MNEPTAFLLTPLLGGVLAGLFQIDIGLALPALRETALNTRIAAESRGTTDYKGLRHPWGSPRA